MAVKADISFGELLDKISILEIKRTRVADAGQRRNIETELAALTTVRAAELPAPLDYADLFARLKHVNQELWSVEDALRDCERRSLFDETFITLARSVYRLNDERGRIKREINERLGSTIVEEKLYAAY